MLVLSSINSSCTLSLWFRTPPTLPSTHVMRVLEVTSYYPVSMFLGLTTSAVPRWLVSMVCVFALRWLVLEGKTFHRIKPPLGVVTGC